MAQQQSDNQPINPPPQHPQQLPIDPTKNVLDLVAAESRYRDSMRMADARLQNMLREKDQIFNTAMREAETRRLNDLYVQKAEFDRSQADLLRLQVAGNAKLVSEQLDRVTNIFSERIAKLEQFRYESSGKGTGRTDVVAYVITFISVAIAAAVLFVKIAPH